MRVFTLPAMIVLLAAAPVAASVAAAQTGRMSPDSVRALDTDPSIPVATPTLGDRPAPGAATAGQAGPDTPVSSRDATGDAGALDPSADPGAGRAAEAARGDLAGGLPERGAPPRTLRAHWHVYAAFTIVWLLLFGYALSLGRRMSRLERELGRLDR